MADNEILDPITGELMSPTDINALLDSYERLDREDRRIVAAKMLIRAAIGDLAVLPQKTQRLRGVRLTAVVERPDSTWDQSQLRAAWAQFPELRDEVLRIESLGVKRREFAKWRATTGDKSFADLTQMIAQAERPATGPPRVRIEEVRSATAFDDDDPF